MNTGRRMGALIAGMLLILAVALCAFHGSSGQPDGHGITPDLCASMIMILVAPVLFTQPVVEGWFVSVSRRFFSGVPSALLDPPPEAISLEVIPGASFCVCTGGLV